MLMSNYPYASAIYVFFFSNDTATTHIYTLSLHDALPISIFGLGAGFEIVDGPVGEDIGGVALGIHRRSEEHTSELQSRFDLVCRLLLEKKNHKRREPG